MKQDIFIVASGTGGHVVPARNIASLLIDLNYTHLVKALLHKQNISEMV